jgi:hypothetical protein
MIEGSCLCGAVTWTFQGIPESATACNCSACRRYGALWAYDFEGDRIKVAGETEAYTRKKASLGFHFCPRCGCITHWRGLEPDKNGLRRIAVNLRLADPEKIEAIILDHFDGLSTFTDLGRDGRCIRDLWF